MSFELFKIPQGKILIAFSDKNLSAGTLELSSGKELPKHNRPVLESLFQIKGKCLMRLFDDGSFKEVILNEGDSIEIPPSKYHIHSNPYGGTSITFWKASGDITKIINEIRENNKM